MTGPLIRAANVSKRFGDVLAVDNVSLEVPPGTILGMIGPNGAGKTTLVRMMVGILKPTSGACYIGDKRSDILSPEERAKVGYMTQQKALYPDLTARENLEFFADTYGVSDLHKRSEAVARVAELTRITEFLNRPVEVLSGGTVQRLSLACTIVHDPELVFLDEPTVGISPHLRAEFWDYFRGLAHQGRTIIMTTHYLEEASRCDTVAMILEGRLIGLGSPSELTSSLPLERTISGEVSPEDSPRLKQALDGIAENEITGSHFRIRTQSDEMLLRAFGVISASGVNARKIMIQQPGLEEAFTYLAGREGQ